MKNTPFNYIIIRNAARQNWLHFRSPQQIIAAETVEDVLPALQTVEKLVNKQGKYAAGWIAYEAAPAFDPAFTVHNAGSFPLLWFGIFGPPEEFHFSEVEAIPHKSLIAWKPSITKRDYRRAIASIKQFIANGDTYQVNYTYRLFADFTEDPWSFFVRLAQAQHSIYGAFLNTERWAICSASPELFFRLDGNDLYSRPMKGTASRGMILSDDLKQAEWLRQSEKNRAENAMIVDMVRNDMGRIAETGSVRVARSFEVEKYPTVWQMTSAVQAKTSASVYDILKTLFPAASITGAPKIRTMEIISQLETTPRRIYTGSIGFIGPNRQAQFNVAIRTVLIDTYKQQAEYGAGGGVVWDSTVVGEFEESKTKTKILTGWPVDFSLLETMLWTPQDGYFLLDRHISRLKDSANYFSIPLDIEAICNKLMLLSHTFSTIPHQVRLLVDKSGAVSCQSFALVDNVNTQKLSLKACLAVSPIDDSNPFYYHKTTHREMYNCELAANPAYNDVLLWNKKSELTEFCLGNIVVEIDNGLFTPPICSGLLGGTYRAMLLEQGKIVEKPLYIEDLAIATSVYRINSVRKWERVELDLRSNSKSTRNVIEYSP